MLYSRGNDVTFVPVAQQSTHWYKTGGGRDGWTANPFKAPASEVLRVGLHDCNSLGCPVKHAGTLEDWENSDDE